jgi:hypothetical protein
VRIYPSNVSEIHDSVNKDQIIVLDDTIQTHCDALKAISLTLYCTSLIHQGSSKLLSRSIIREQVPNPRSQDRNMALFWSHLGGLKQSLLQHLSI